MSDEMTSGEDDEKMLWNFRPLPGAMPNHIPRREIEKAEELKRDVIELTEKYGTRDIVISSNLTTGYRDPESQHLFVRQEPLQIRPFEDTGVEAAHDVEQESVKLTLNNPKGGQEWNHLNLLHDHLHTLCIVCKDLLNYYSRYVAEETADSDCALSNAVIHHSNLLSLQAFAIIQHCYLCRVLRHYLYANYRDIFDNNDPYKFYVEACWTRSTTRKSNGRIEFFLVNRLVPRDFPWNHDHFFKLDVWPTDIYEHCFKLPEIALEQLEAQERNLGETNWRSRVLRFESTRSPISKALALAWLAKCTSNAEGKHSACNQSYDSVVLPTRLLDVEYARQNSRLRIVLPQDSPEEFRSNREWITLSHCWGSSGALGNPILTKANLELRKSNGIAVQDLPSTFQDAIEICSWLKKRWLWIDCLCIVQDSREDWIGQAKLMSKTYQQAFLCISADAAANSNGGCFVKRDSFDLGGTLPVVVSNPELDQSWSLTPAPAYMFDWMNDAPSFSRAWVQRERQLSRRILHFTSQEILWECCGEGGTSFASESLPGGSPSKPWWNLESKFQSGRLQKRLVENAEETWAIWNDTCEMFSRKNLSKASDMPIILSTLAEEFATSFLHDTYVAGHWRSQLPQCLLWDSNSMGRYNSRKNSAYIAPSWSWLSTGRSVNLANRFDMSRKWPLALVHGVNIDYEDSDHFGAIKGGSIELEGILRKVKLKYMRMGRTNGSPLSAVKFKLWVMDSEDDEKYRFVGDAWNEYDGKLCEVTLDERPETDTLECSCFFLQIQQHGILGMREVGCLLLTRHNDGNYSRIGVLTLHLLYSLKMAYRPKSIIDSVDTEEEPSRVPKWDDFVKCGQEGGSDAPDGSYDIPEDAWISLSEEIKGLQSRMSHFVQEMKKKQRENDELNNEEKVALEWAQTPPPTGFDALYHFDRLSLENLESHSEEEISWINARIEEWDRITTVTIV